MSQQSKMKGDLSGMKEFNSELEKNKQKVHQILSITAPEIDPLNQSSLTSEHHRSFI